MRFSRCATRSRCSLGYKSWADYQTEIKMAKSGAAASKFINDLVAGVQPKFDAELEEFRKLKATETGDPKAKINIWDCRYYTNELKKQHYTVDAEALRVYFPFQQTLDGMFNIYQSIFGLKFEQVAAPNKWIDDLQLWVVTDAATGEPLGMFYLDMFPREGKFNHFAQFGIIGGKRLADGKYQRPTVALLCNFPPPSEGKPSLLTHIDVETLFHEFGHVMHSILTRRTVCPIRRHECARRLRRGAVANAASLGLGQKGARYLRRGLPRSGEKDSGRDNRENERGAAGD